MVPSGTAGGGVTEREWGTETYAKKKQERDAGQKGSLSLAK
jgi:hypothetical protein